MTDLVLRAARHDVLLSHLTLFGLGAIVEDRFGTDATRISWSTGMDPRPVVTVDGAQAPEFAAAVVEHATTHTQPGSWVQEQMEGIRPAPALLSPRIANVAPEQWESVNRQREEVIDRVWSRGEILDLRLIGALGRPGGWYQRPNNVVMQSAGASAYEMQPRNQGSEFVGTRLRALSAAVGARSTEAILAGLTSAPDIDDRKGVRPVADLTPAGDADVAMAWAACWGMTLLPVVQGRVWGSAATAGHLRKRRTEAFVLPVWSRPLRMARVRALLVDGRLGTAVERQVLREADAPESPAERAARRWLRSASVRALTTFRITEHGGTSAPQRRAGLGRLHPVG